MEEPQEQINLEKFKQILGEDDYEYLKGSWIDDNDHWKTLLWSYEITADYYQQQRLYKELMEDGFFKEGNKRYLLTLH
jgi:hypothetical protein